MIIDFQKVADAIEKSSPEIQDLMFSQELGDILIHIANKNNLDEERYLLMVDEVGYVILGLKEAFSFEDSLNQIGIEKNSSYKIKQEVESEVFSKINKPKIGVANPIINNNSAIKKQPILRWSEMFFSNKPVKNKIDDAKKIRLSIKEKGQNKNIESLQDLPDTVQELVFQGNLLERTEEIAKKYSLNPSQTDILINNVLFVLVGIDSGEGFIKSIPQELGISKLLGEQIVDDLEIRVFEYAIKSIENRESKKETATIPAQPENKNLVEINEKIPEVRPYIVPMVEEGESVKVVEPPHSFAPKFIPPQQPASEILRNQQKVKEEVKPEPSRISYKPKEVVDEIVQKPIPVPRFTATPENAPEKPVENKTVNTTNNVPIPLKTTPPIPEPPKQQEKPVHKYVSDPYREPIE